MTTQPQGLEAQEPPVAAPEGAAPAELLIAALATFQRDCPTIAKTQTATVPTKTGGSYSYTYADLADVLGIVRPLLARNGLVVVQRTRREAETGKTILTTELRHVAGAMIDSEVDLGQTTANAQQFGGALTYLRRYELTTLLGIAAEDDTDAQHVERPGSSSTPAPAPLPGWAQPASEETMGNWLKALAEVGVDEETAARIGDGLVKAWGHFPAGATSIAKAIAKAVNPPLEAPPADGDIPDGAGPPPPGVGGDLPLDDLEAQAIAGEEPQDGPPLAAGPATIPLPIAELRAVEDGDGADDQRRRILAAAGCTCQDPLGPDGEKNAACPIVGHGIPF